MIQNQLVQVLMQCGIPEDQLSPFMLNFQTQNPSLDIISGILCAGLYPNVCYHKEKRKVRFILSCYCFYFLELWVVLHREKY